MEIFAFWAITREPIKIKIHTASQNDRQNLGFLKDIYEYGEKMARNGGEMVIYESQILVLTLYHNRLSSKSIRVTKLSFCQNDSPVSIVTLILIELCLL